ncbi:MULTISPECIES: OmpH family outer membrane protein [Mesoflavibacter]|uniref:OmpH family outer membrane protein n=1 Tax=Mesoflavibacter profundi TaxID=2708110 RepID=A0ABT4S342_9FLAO|nr:MULTISPECIES: OmpH family outer membrane protein [Mesoflavibacter]MDA0178333.1 OmpH family outer membrane protein [Mesoflavibacter profundi]QIJ89295.1 Outer membrane protein H precursor [Mesoflavibacter sp. HG96]QIJ92023.1 Outer membrane protein H precursor [Mesoflavibacter sp. HG37]
MKQFKTLLFAVALFIGATSFSNAQTKVAHINVGELVTSMPEMKAAQTEMEKMGKTFETDIQEMMKEYQSKAKQYEGEAATKTNEENQKRGEELAGMQQSIRQFQADAQQQLQKKELDLLEPITKKAKAAILKVAKAQGFNYVLDSSQGSGVIMAEGKDLLTDVQKELGF